MSLVGIGLLFIFFRMTNISLSSLWPLILVALGMYQLRSGGDQKQAKTFMAVGGILLAFTLNLFGFIAGIWPLAFILAGLYFLTKNNNSEVSNTISSTFETAGRGANKLFKLVTRTIRNNISSTKSNVSSSFKDESTQTSDAHYKTVDTTSTKTLNNSKHTKAVSDPGLSSTVMFSSNKLLPDTINADGSSTCLFGDLKIDLRDVKEAPENLKLNLTCGFGDVGVKVPADWRVELRSSSFFADVSNEARTKDTPTTTLQVDANCFFGDISITN